MDRDYHKDLEVCSKATKGPWMSYRATFDDRVYTKLEDGCRGLCVCVSEREAFKSNKTNIDFIALSREALPYYIERCMEMESKLKTIQENDLHIQGRDTLDK